MEKELLQKVKDDYADEHGYSDFFEMKNNRDEAIGEDDIDEISDRYARAYHAKQSQKQHLVELMKMDEGNDGEPEYTEGICGDGAAILKDGVQMTVSEILSELKSKPVPLTHTGENCFTKEMIEDRFGFHATEKEVEWFNSKAHQYATDRAKKALENILLTKENWPLVDLLNKLLEAADILLHKKDYDGHGWEDIEHAAKRMKEYVKTITNPKNLEV